MGVEIGNNLNPQSLYCGKLDIRNTEEYRRVFVCIYATIAA